MEISINKLISESFVMGSERASRSYRDSTIVNINYPIISPTFKLNEDRNTIFLEFPNAEGEDDDRLSLKTSEVLFKREESGYDLEKLVHDFTFGSVTQTNDVPISAFIPRDSHMIPSSLKPKLDYTPDYIDNVDGKLVLVEFGTKSSSNMEALQSYFDVKKHKYTSIMNSLAPYITIDYEVFVIIVGREGVVTNMVLPDSFKDTLVYRYRVIKQVDNMLIDSSIKVRPVDVTISANTKKFIQMMSSFEVSGDSEYSKKNYERLVFGEVDPKFTSETIHQAWVRAVEYVDKRNVWDISRNGKREAYSLSKTALNVAKHISEAQEKAPDGFNKHNKSIVNAPLIVPKACTPNPRIKGSKFLTQSIKGDYTDETFRLWASARENISMNDDFVDNTEHYDAFCELTNDPEGLINHIDDLPIIGPKPSETRNLYCRVKLDIPQEDAVELAKVGVQGKSFIMDKHPAVLEYRKSRQAPFHLFETDVSDFDAMFNSDLRWMIDSDLLDQEPHMMKERLHLIDRAMRIHGDSELTEKYYRFMKEIGSTPYMQWSSWISDIAFELCLALRQGCKKDTFIIKKMKDWECYILIKPVRLSSKIFFSLLWFDEDMKLSMSPGNVFRQYHSNGVVNWTDFVSLDQNKIENWALCESRTFAMIPYWLEFHGLEPFLIKDKAKENSDMIRSSLQMMLLYTCIELADKSEIEQEASLFRYMFMKSLTSEPLIPEPEVVIEDFKKPVRSRLTIWIQKRLIDYCVHVARGNVVICQEDLDLHGHSISTSSSKKLTWRGLINPYNSMRLKNPGDAVNLMYIAHVQNKNLNAEGNTFGKMLEKILVLEDDFTEEIKARIGVKNKPIGVDTKHEYNIDLLLTATEYCKKTYLPKLHGDGSLLRKIEDVVNTIANTYIDDVFATLKATSNFDEKFFHLTAEEYHRMKVIEKAQSYVHGENTKVSDILKTCFNEVDGNGYMRIDIFQKNQHGGIREIYVLGFAERVVQWVIETLSRGLCSLFPGETMTHPDNKKRLPEEYFKNIKIKHSGKPTMTFATSADASKWSQNMYSHKFAIMLCRLLPDYLHGFIWKSLAFWKNKYIMIPQTLIKRFHERDDLKFYNKYMEGLYYTYKGREDMKWARKEEAFIRVQTGMMQGILHYTSSLFHSVMNVFTEMLTMKRFSAVTGMGVEPLIMQSSDDSCEILTCETPDNPRGRAVALYMMAISQIFKSELGEEVGIKNSAKKTAFHLQFTFEFNSAFHFGPSRYESDIKMLSSSLICTDRENIVDRHMEQYTQLTNFINAGGSIYSATFIQGAQALFNYRLLGSSVTSRFRILYCAYLQLPDPNLGFFLMDNSLFTGLSGYKYNLWKVIQNTGVGITYKHYLNDALVPSEKNAHPDLLTTKNGLLAKRAVLSFGNRQKLLKIVDRMKLPEDWQDLLDKDPSLYFRHASNTEEFKILCALKMFSPGVQESLSTGNVTTRIMASSAYITLCTVMRSLGEWNKRDDLNLAEGNMTSTYNLTQLVQHELKILIKEVGALTNDELTFLFPYHEEYLALEQKLASCDYRIPARKIIDYRRVTTDIRVFDRDNITALPPDVIMSAIWFEDNDLVRKPLYPMKYLRECYFSLKKVIPWLSDSLEKTLRDGPFKHINGLAAWLSQYHQKDKIVVIIGAPIISRRGSSSILGVIRQNFHKTFQLENMMKDTEVITSSEYDALKQALLLMLSYPSAKRDMEKRVTMLMKSKFSSSMEYNNSAKRSRYNLLCIFRDAILTNADPKQILERISQGRVGVVGGYTMKQQFDPEKFSYYGPGTWIGKFYDKKVMLVVNSYIDENGKDISYLEEIHCEDLYPTDDLLYCLKTWCEENWVSDVLPEEKRKTYSTRTIAINYGRRAGLTPGVKTRYYKKKFSDDDRGIPVFVTNDLLNHLGTIKSFYLDIPINKQTGMSDGVIKLMGVCEKEMRQGYKSRGDMTLARYIVSHRDYLGSQIVDVPLLMSEANAAWVKNVSMSLRGANAVLKSAMAGENTHMTEHVREVLRNTFSRKGLKLGKKRDELALIKTAYQQYTENLTKRGLSSKGKCQKIPSVHEIFKHDEEGTDFQELKPRTLKWSEEVEELEKEKALRTIDFVDSLSPSQVDEMFNMVDSDKINEAALKEKAHAPLAALIQKFLHAKDTTPSEESATFHQAEEMLKSFEGNDYDIEQGIEALQFISDQRVESPFNLSGSDSGTLQSDHVSESQEAVPEEKPGCSKDQEDQNVDYDMNESQVLDDSADALDEDDIDWGDDDEADALISHHMNNLTNISEQYKDVLNIIIKGDQTVPIEVESDLLAGVEADFDCFSADYFFRELEMINSSEFRVSMSMKEANFRNSLVKKEHSWFTLFVNEWFSNHANDINKIFHKRLVTDALRKAGFLEIMNFLFPGVTFQSEEEPIRFPEEDPDFDPFSDDHVDSL